MLLVYKIIPSLLGQVQMQVCSTFLRVSRMGYEIIQSFLLPLRSAAVVYAVVGGNDEVCLSHPSTSFHTDALGKRLNGHYSIRLVFGKRDRRTHASYKQAMAEGSEGVLSYKMGVK